MFIVLYDDVWPVSSLESDRQEMMELWFLFWTKEGMLLLVRLHRMWMSFLYVSLFCALGCPLAGPWLAPGCPSSGPGWPPAGPWLASSSTQACNCQCMWNVIFVFLSILPPVCPWLSPSWPLVGHQLPFIGPWLAFSGPLAGLQWQPGLSDFLFESVSKTEANSSQMTLVWFYM